MLKVIGEFGDYSPWSGAVSNYEELERLGKLDDFEILLEEYYPEGISQTGINDILWFEFDWVKEHLGIEEGEEEEEEE